MKKLAIIPSRYESSRFPGKPLIDLKGKTMIQRVYEGVQNANVFDEIVVATDDQRIFDHVLSFEGNVIMTETSHQSGTERCGEVIQHYQDSDIVVNIQGDEPLVNAQQLKTLIKAFDDPSVQISTLGSPKISADDIANPNRIKIVVNEQSNALYFSRSPIPYTRNQIAYPFLKHIGLYAFKRETLEQLIHLQPTDLEKIESLEQLRWLYYGFQIKVMQTTIETPNIDVPYDVDKVMKFL